MYRTAVLLRGIAMSAGAAAIMAASAHAAAAQNSATINATATVLQPLVTTGTNDLSFGNVYPGVTKLVGYSDATNAGRFTVTGYGGAEVSISFTLPTDLAGPSNSALPIGSWSGYHNTANSTGAGGTEFTPSSAQTTTRLGGTAPANGSLHVFLGATVTPSAAQAQGTYTGTVTMTVAYTGN
jgi:hypothetical protein